jgi:signal transduction histidine kinase
MKHDLSNYVMKIKTALKLADFAESGDNHIQMSERLLDEMYQLLQHSVELADAGLAIEKKEHVSLNDLVDDIAASEITNSVEFLRDDLPTIMADRTKLVQVFHNLVQNAVIHGKPKTIRIMRKEDIDGRMRVCVVNDGKPIPYEIRDEILTQKYLSTGVRNGYGLAIVRRIVEAHGWRIGIGDNEETSFEIHIAPADLIGEG